MKGQDYVDWLDDFVGKNTDFTYTFIGRTQSKLKNSKHIPPLNENLLAQELGKYDVCINASRFDPGPNSVIESISCKVPTYVHSNGGGAVEFAGKDHVFSTYDELEQILLKKQFNMNDTKFTSWLECSNQFVELFKTLI